MATTAGSCRSGWATAGPGSDPRLDDHAAASVRCERDRAALNPFGGAALGQELDLAQDRAQHDPHLVEGEARAQAAADASAEGNPFVGAGLAIEEALGAEAVRLGIQLGPAVEQVDRRGHIDAGGVAAAT